MKKTVHINIAGHAFSIEEDAYERLDAYLDAVKARLGNSDEAQETLEDINLRIAELFRGVHKDAASPITMEDVEEVMSTLGRPEDYEVPVDGEGSEEEDTTEWPRTEKQLFRDPDNRFLGGVCGGLGHYFNLDPVLFRLLFIIATLFYGTSLLVYIILWIAIPRAVTVQQRIMMMGGAPGSDRWRRKHISRPIGNNASEGVLRVLAIGAGVFLVLVSFISLATLIMTFSLSEVIFGRLFNDGAWIPELSNYFLLPGQQLLGFIGFALTLGIPLLVLFYLGMHLIFRFRKGGVPFLVTSLVLWLAGIGMLSYTGVSVAGSYANRLDVEERKELKVPSSDTIFIRPGESSLKLGEGQHIFSKGGISIKKQDDDIILVGTPEIEVEKGGSAFRIIVEKTARGKSSDEAIDNANKIEYFYLQDDSLLWLDRYFSVPDIGLMRGQKVDVTIEVPENKQLKVADEFQHLIEIKSE